MDNVKSENRDSVCSGCLSSDRHTSDIERQDLFVMLLSKQTLGYVESKYLNIQLCWECNAMLRKIALFQQKINEAQYILETSLHLGQIHSDLTTLSSLKISHNAEYDYAINYEEELLQRQTVEAQNLLQEHLTIEIVKKETEEHNDLSYDYDVKDEYSLSDSDAVNKKKEKKAMLGKFEKKAIITKNELDLKKLEKYFKKTVMDNCEMEDVLQKERDCKRGKSQYRYACKKCKIKYKRVMDVNRHCDFAHSLKTTPLHCSECNETCDTQSLLDNHWKTHNVLFKCMFCITYCRSKCEMNLHLINTHSRVYTCKNCGMQIYSSQQFTNHYKNYHTKFICDDCGRVFGIKRNLEKHMIKEHFPPFCQVCNRQFPKYHSLEVHYRNFHPELIYKTVKREESYCVECDRQFPSQYLYKRHLSTAVAHVQKAPVKIPCPECGKIFSRKTYMKNHYKLVHVRATSHYCEICNKHFVSGFSLRTHRKFVHEKTVKPKDKICDVCGRGFHTNRTLLNHKRTHTGERPYKCTYCPAAFAQSYARTTHERSQHKNISDVFILPT